MNHVSVFPSRTVICIEKHTELESLTIKFIIWYIIIIKAIDYVNKKCKNKSIVIFKADISEEILYAFKYCVGHLRPSSQRVENQW